MHRPTATELLEVWERSLDRPGPYRAIALVASLRPELTLEELGGLTIGQRDALLLQLREHLFGPRMQLIADCPACSVKLETTLRLGDLQTERQPALSPLALSLEGYRVSFRLPAAADLIGLPQEIEAARLALLDRCLIRAKEIAGGENRCVRAADLPEPVILAIAEAMADADPRADAQLDLNCPSCQHRWPAVFDIVSALWREIHAWAKRILREVDALARAYGWREADVLSLSPTRRQMYLELSRQ
jgi:hypothetical protein